MGGQETSQKKAEVVARGRGTSVSPPPRVCSRPSGEGWGSSGGGRPLSPVPQGWKWHSPSCFWLGEDRVPYSDARKTCSDYGSTLVTITNRSVPRWRWWFCPPKTSSLRQGATRPLGFARKGWSITGFSASRHRPLSPPLQVRAGVCQQPYLRLGRGVFLDSAAGHQRDGRFPLAERRRGYVHPLEPRPAR